MHMPCTPFARRYLRSSCQTTAAMHLAHMRLLLTRSEFKRREKAARVAKEREEKKASTECSRSAMH